MDIQEGRREGEREREEKKEGRKEGGGREEDKESSLCGHFRKII